MLSGYELAVACLALNIYHEASTPPHPVSIPEQYAIAFVTINRAKQRKLDMCDVVFQPKQFSWANNALDGKGRLLPRYIPKANPHWHKAREVATIALSGDVLDFTGGATHYHATYIPAPRWATKMEAVGRHGIHIFYRTQGH